MTIRRRLTLSYLAILSLLACNLMFYFWSDSRRRSGFEDLTRAITRQTLTDSIQQKLNDFQKEVSLLGQLQEVSGRGKSPEEVAHFGAQLDSVGDQIRQLGDLSDSSAKQDIAAFSDAFQQLSASWRIFYQSIGPNQARAITEMAIRGDPLSQKVIQQLLPRVQQDEAKRDAGSTVRYYDAARLTGRITVAIFMVSGFLAGLFGLLVSRHFTHGLDALKSGADALGAGQLDYRIGFQARDEMGDLARAFNEMAYRLNSARGELTRANNQLEERRQELEVLMRAAESANSAKSQFLANMSHELRTPMNAIIGYSEMLVEEAQDMDQQSFIPDLRKINAAGKHLLSLINDILDLSKIEAGKMDLYLETFDVHDMIRDVATTMAPLVEKNANRLVIDVEPEAGAMHADLTKVRQALFNLLSNACKFTRTGVIEVKVRSVGPLMVFRIADSGIGMTPEQTAWIFDAFTQADTSTTRKYGGTGLGLTITRRFCEMMGGEITVESEMGKGTVFTIRLPIEVAEPHTPPPALPRPVEAAAAQKAGSGADGSVLVIDDDPVVQDLMRSFLSKEGYRVTAASDGRQGLKAAVELRPDVITLDVAMPGMDGWSVLEALKADPALAEIPVIMVTIIDNKSMGYALGAAEYLTKPINRDRLVTVLRKYRRFRDSQPVLVVEDDLDAQQTLKSTLEKDGWAVLTAENGRVALSRIAGLLPGLVLLDLMMPEMDGFVFLEEFRRLPGAGDVPVIVLTAKDLSAEDHRRLNGYVEKILQKGLSRELLLKEVRELVAARVHRHKVDGN